jgi:heme/copper-type cytochrome/quinol oxidase subunit 2
MAALIAALILTVAGGLALVGQNRKDFAVSARKYAYKITAGGSEIKEMRVQVDDMVTITFSAEDIAHSFTIDAYRIDRRAEPGKPPVTIRFRADKEGKYDIRCTLNIDDRCLRDMKGALIVEGRR